MTYLNKISGYVWLAYMIVFMVVMLWIFGRIKRK